VNENRGENPWCFKDSLKSTPGSQGQAFTWLHCWYLAKWNGFEGHTVVYMYRNPEDNDVLYIYIIHLVMWYAPPTKITTETKVYTSTAPCATNPCTWYTQTFRGCCGNWQVHMKDNYFVLSYIVHLNYPYKYRVCWLYDKILHLMCIIAMLFCSLRLQIGELYKLDNNTIVLRLKNGRLDPLKFRICTS